MTTLIGDYSPSLQELSSMNLDGRTVPISREILADLDTPVSAYLKVRENGPSFLLESVEGGERLGRYSFIGSSPRRVLRMKNGHAWFDADPPEQCQDPLQAVRSIVQAYRPAIRPRARFEGGALGYLAYEAARYFERLPVAPMDPLDLPDAVFLDVDTVLVFDHVARKIRIELEERGLHKQPLGVDVVVGTTGWLDHLDHVKSVVEKSGIGLVWSPNYSIGVHAFLQMVSEAARLLANESEYDAWAWEIHHAAKKDAPSGTLLKLVEEMQKAGYRRRIDVSSNRAGAHPGTHEIGFDSPADTITLRHTARGRQGLARGALKAARWVVGKRGLFAFRDVLSQ